VDKEKYDKKQAIEEIKEEKPKKKTNMYENRANVKKSGPK
jgi:hypothetical protein